MMTRNHNISPGTGTRAALEAIWHSKLICATHFNYWAWEEEEDGYCWQKKRWDQHHRQGQDDVTHEE